MSYAASVPCKMGFSGLGCDCGCGSCLSVPGMSGLSFDGAGLMGSGLFASGMDVSGWGAEEWGALAVVGLLGYSMIRGGGGRRRGRRRR